jgi:transcriptional regulator with XRE-family HTH domain
VSDDLNIGRTIKVLRTSAGLKQLELADRVKVSPNYLSLVEAGRKEPSLSLLKKLSHALDVPLVFLMWDSTDHTHKFNADQRHVYLKLKDSLLDFERLRIARRTRPRQVRRHSS